MLMDLAYWLVLLWIVPLSFTFLVYFLLIFLKGKFLSKKRRIEKLDNVKFRLISQKDNLAEALREAGIFFEKKYPTSYLNSGVVLHLPRYFWESGARSSSFEVLYLAFKIFFKELENQKELDGFEKDVCNVSLRCASAIYLSLLKYARKDPLAIEMAYSYLMVTNRYIKGLIAMRLEDTVKNESQ